MEELIGIRIRAIYDSERDIRCDTAAGDNKHAEYVITKPLMLPPLPGPRLVYLCRRCLTEFLAAIAMNVED